MTATLTPGRTLSGRLVSRPLSSLETSSRFLPSILENTSTALDDSALPLSMPQHLAAADHDSTLYACLGAGGRSVLQVDLNAYEGVVGSRNPALPGGR